MKNWYDIKTTDQLAKRYLSYVPALQEVAKKCGYALGVHGSCKRDLDLIAVPWAPKAYTAESLVMMLEEAMLGSRSPRSHWKKDALKDPKPHGRKAYAIVIAHLNGEGQLKKAAKGHPLYHAYLDVSVMPTVKPAYTKSNE